MGRTHATNALPIDSPSNSAKLHRRVQSRGFLLEKTVRAVLVCSLSLLVAACATPQAVPNARPLSQANIAAIGPTRASVTGTEQGVAKSWFYTDVNGAGGGLVGALVGAVAAGIMNATPGARARRQANEAAELVTPQMLNDSLAARLREVASPPREGAVTLSDVVVTQKVVTKGELADVLELTTTYTLSEDSSVLRVASMATYRNPAIPYRSPYSFAKAPPKSETMGPLYRNIFTYYSTPLPVPALTPELKERLVASVQESMRDASGNLPAEGAKEYKDLQREIELARDDRLTGGESSVFLTREWLRDRGGPLQREVDRAHEFLAKYLALDINRTAVPSLTGTDELLETLADDRTVRRLGAGVEAGSYVSSAANVTSPATYGNTAAVGKATQDYVRGLKPQRK